MFVSVRIKEVSLVNVGADSYKFEKLGKIVCCYTGLWIDLVLENSERVLEKSLKVLEYDFHNPVQTLHQCIISLQFRKEYDRLKPPYKTGFLEEKADEFMNTLIKLSPCKGDVERACMIASNSSADPSRGHCEYFLG